MVINLSTIPHAASVGNTRQFEWCWFSEGGPLKSLAQRTFCFRHTYSLEAIKFYWLLLKVNLSLLQYSDGRRQKGRHCYKGAEPRHVTHVALFTFSMLLALFSFTLCR